MHLSSEADSLHLAFITVCGQFSDSFHTLSEPVFRILLGPSGMREIQRVFPGYDFTYFPIFIHQQQLYCRCTKINSYKQHALPPAFAADAVFFRNGRVASQADAAGLLSFIFSVSNVSCRFFLPNSLQNYPHGFSVGYLTPAG